ncbi:hypothetical protein LTR94_024483 [Friedmanniomyces endolithicus]|nr:hypothetical protein LTR94_024483 [Friedmanniomyces endolithicus]
MRAPRLALLVSACALAFAASAQAQTDQTPPPQAQPAAAPAAAPTEFTDLQLKQYGDAITKAEMAAAVQNSGLDVEAFNAISTAVAVDPVLTARVELASATPPAAGSPAAGVTDDELNRFVTAMTQIRAVTAGVQNGQATPEQSAQLTAAVQGSGLEVERFNAIAQVVSQDKYLQAKAALAGARQEKGVSQ